MCKFLLQSTPTHINKVEGGVAGLILITIK